jgi:hypothetical protein
LPYPIDELFPLFSPEGEKKWVPGWDYKNVMESVDLFEDYVFLTQTHDHSSSDAVWIVKKYDPDRYTVQFYKIEPDHKVGIVTVRCAELGTSKTDIEVTYKYIALSESGEKFVSEFTEIEYEKFINEWQRLLSDYFESQR